MRRRVSALVGLVLVLQAAPAAAQSGGRIIFFEGYNRDSAFNGHRAMSGDGGTIRDLPEIPITQLGRFALNRDGSRVAFADKVGLFAGNARFEERVLLGRLIEVGLDDFGIGSPDWSPSGELIAVSGPGPTFNPPADETMGVSVVPAGGGSQTFASGSNNLAEPSWAPDERRIVAVQQGSNLDPVSRLIVLDRVAGTATALYEEQPGVQIYHPQWSPDGSQIVYERRSLSDPRDVALWRVAADGSGARELTPGAGGEWSPDGGSLVFVRFSGPFASAIYTIRADGSGLRRVRSVPRTNQAIAGWVSGDLAPLAPALGRSAVAEGVRGTILVRRPRSSRFRQLIGEDTVPVGSVLDTRRGTVRLTTASNRGGGRQSGTFGDGIFKLLQARSARPVTELRLTGRLERCARSRGGRAAARVRGRQLQGTADGSFRIRGRRSAATGKAASWLVADRCDGTTLTRVRSGSAGVRDFVRRRTVVVRAGRRYVAG